MLRILSNIKTYASFLLEIMGDLDEVDLAELRAIRNLLAEMCKRHGIDINKSAFRKE